MLWHYFIRWRQRWITLYFLGRRTGQDHGGNERPSGIHLDLHVKPQPDGGQAKSGFEPEISEIKDKTKKSQRDPCVEQLGDKVKNIHFICIFH